MHPETLIRIKVEIDTDPSVVFDDEQNYLTELIPVSVRCVNQECLFAGKMHAALFRAWKGRVKGRDWYDMVWFIRKNIPLNLALFSQLNQQKETLSHLAFLQMAHERIDQLDVTSAIADIIHFVRDQEAIQKTWSKEFFHYWIDRIKTKSESTKLS